MKRKGKNIPAIEKEGKIGRISQLPLRVALKFTLQNIRIRFGREVLAAGGTLLGTAFLMSTFMQNTIRHAVEKEIPPDIQARATWIAVIALIVCTIGIMNSMLIAVTERYREIGTMKCLGALDSLIVRLFLLEALILGVSASIGGSILGFIFSFFVYWGKYGWSKLIHHLPVAGILNNFLLVFAIGVVLTIIATIWPAYRASRLPAAAALRVEI
ncbi:FtsX-like permease family protein [bacterium]|nr:FtsX-like permease family protein [bacterium]